jgi:hypothetical protein
MESEAEGVSVMTTYGIVPCRQPQPTGNATGTTAEAREQREELREEVAAQTPKPLHATEAEHDALIDERMRAMTPADRVFREAELTERRWRSNHTYDYDPLSWSAAYGSAYDPLPVDVGPMGWDNWGPDLPREKPQAAARVVGKPSWYDRK